MQLTRKPQEMQRATYTSTIGPDVITIFNSFNLTETEQVNVNEKI